MKVRSCLRLPVNYDGAAYNNLPANTAYFYSLDCAEKLIEQLAKQYTIIERFDYKDYIMIELEMDI